MLSEGTTSCLGVSYVNDCTPMVAACEGGYGQRGHHADDETSNLHKIVDAQSGLQPDGTVNFSHCTAPICCMGVELPVRCAAIMKAASASACR
ncbi:MAG: hypothetical protein V8T36_05755 [Ruthenibacterium lactatiformans]